MPHHEKNKINYSNAQYGDPNVADGIYTLQDGSTYEVKGGGWKWVENKEAQQTSRNQIFSNQTQFFANAPQSTESYLYGQRPDAKVINQYDTDLIQESRYNPADFKPKTVLPKTQEQKLAEAEAQAQETAYKQMQTIGAANVQSDTGRPNYLAEIEQAKAYNTQQEAMMTEEYWKQALSPEDFAFLKEQLAYSQALDPNKTIKEVGEEFLAKKSTDFTNRFSQGALSEEEINALPIELRNDYYQGVIDDKTLEAARKSNPSAFLPSGRAGWVSVEPYLIGGLGATRFLGAAIPALGRSVGITSGSQLMNTSIPNYLGLSGTGATGVALEQLTLNNALNAIGAGMIPEFAGEAVENFQEGDYLEGFGNAAFATLNALPFIGPTAKGVKTLSTKISEFGNTKYNNLDEILTNVSKKGNIQFEKDINGVYNIKTKNANGEWETMPELVALEREMSAIPGQAGLGFRAGEIEEIINLAKKNPVEFKQWMATNPDISSYPTSVKNAIENFVSKIRNVVPEVEVAQKGLKGDYIPMVRVDELNRRIGSTLSTDLNFNSTNPMRSGNLTTGSFLETHNSIIRALEGNKSANTISIHRLNDLSTEAAFGSTQGMRDTASAKFDDLLSNIRTGISNILKDRPDLFTDKNLQGLLNSIKIHNKTATKGKAIKIPWSSLAQNGTITPNQYLGEIISEASAATGSKITQAFDNVVGQHIQKAFEKINQITDLNLTIPKVDLKNLKLGLPAQSNVWGQSTSSSTGPASAWSKTIDDMNASIAKVDIPGKPKTDVGIRFYSTSPGHIGIRINPEKAISLLPEAVREEVRKSFEVYKKKVGGVTKDADGTEWINLGYQHFGLPEYKGTRPITFSDILKGNIRQQHEFSTPGSRTYGPTDWSGPTNLDKAPISKGGDWPYQSVKTIDTGKNPDLIPFKNFILGEEFKGFQFPGHQISGRISKSLGQSLKESDAMLTSGGTGHTAEGTLRYISGLLDLGGTDQFTIIGSRKGSKFQDVVNRIAKSPKEKAELQEQIKKIKAAWKGGESIYNIPEVQQGLYRELANEISSVTFGIKKYGGSLNTNQYGLGSYMAPQDLDPETMKRYLADLRTLENSVKAGYKGSKWYPHKSYEGGMPTIGYGHKVTKGEDFSGGLSESEARALQKKDVLTAQSTAKSQIDKQFGKGTFDSLPQNSQMLAVDYAYNVGLNKFPSFTKALVAGDKAGMLKEFQRFSGGNPLKERNKWTEGVINALDFKNGGSFNNAGFKSLPLQVQHKIMKRSNKFEVGGLETVDPKNVQEIMNKLYQETRSSGYTGNDPSEFMMPNTSEYNTEYQAELSRISSMPPTDDYIEIGGKMYSAEDYFAAIKANPPSSYFMPNTTQQGSFFAGAARYDKPPVLSSSYVPATYPYTAPTVATPDTPKVLGANTGEELTDRPPVDPKTGQPLITDYQYPQYISQAANDPARLQAKADQRAAMEANVEALKYLTEDEQARARQEGLTATEYTEKYRPKAEDMKVVELPEGGFKYGGNIFAGGGNMYPNGSTLNHPPGMMQLPPNLVEDPNEHTYKYINPKTGEPFVNIAEMKAFSDYTLGKGHFDQGYLNNPATEEAAKLAEIPEYMSNIHARGGMMNQYAMGAQMPQGQMTDIPTTEFNAGGSHEANAMGGVYQGMASNGKPNLVEQGELKITIPGTDEQFIVSPKIKLDKETAEEFGLSKKHVGKDMVKIFKALLRKNNFAEREGDSIVENSKQLEIMPYVAAHQKLTEIANAKDQAKKQEAFDKDMTQMMEKHPEYMEALMAQSQQPMQQQGPSPEEMAMMEQQGAMQGGMPPMMATYGGNIRQFGGPNSAVGMLQNNSIQPNSNSALGMMANGGNMYEAGGSKAGRGWDYASKGLGILSSAAGNIPGIGTALGAGFGFLEGATGALSEQAQNYALTGDRMKLHDVDLGALTAKGAVEAGKGALGTAGNVALSAADELTSNLYEDKSEIALRKFQESVASNPNSPENLRRIKDAEKLTGNPVGTGEAIAGQLGTMALQKGAQMGAEKITENLAENALETGIGMIARYGGKQYKCGGKMCKGCYGCGGKMHTYGGNMFNLGGGAEPPSGPIITEGVIPIEEDLNLLAENPYISDDAKRKYLHDEIMDTSLEEGIKDVTIEGGYLSALKAAPLITSGIMAFSPSESYSAGDLGYRATTAPKINYRQARRDIQRQAEKAAKDLKGAGPTGYKSNRIASQQAANQALANISMQEENINKQMSYQNALQNAGRYQQAAVQAAMMTGQSEAAKAKALQDFGITVGSLGSGIARDYMEAGMANMYSPDIDLNYRMFGNSFLGGIKTNKDRAAKSEKKSKRKSNV